MAKASKSKRPPGAGGSSRKRNVPALSKPEAVGLINHPAVQALDTAKQQLFVVGYATHGNATRAATEAGYGGPEGTDYDTLRAIASENLTKPNIREAVNALLAERIMGKEEALARLSDEARADLGDFMAEGDDGGIRLTLRQAKERGLTRLLKKVKTRTVTTSKDGEDRTEQTVEFEMYDAQAAKDKILRAHGAYPTGSGTTTNVQVNVQNNTTTILPPPPP